MKRCFQTLALLAVGLISTTEAFAQSADEANYDSSPINEEQPIVGLPSPPDRFDTLTQGVDLSISISEKKEEASISYSFGERSTQTDGNGVARLSGTFWKVGLDAPVGGKTDLFSSDLDLLDNQWKLSASWNLLRASSSSATLDGSVFGHLEPEARALCKKKNPDLDCDIPPPGTIVHDYLPDEHRKLRKYLYDPFYTIGLKGSVGYQEFDWVQAGTLDEFDPKELSFSGTASFNYYPSDTVSAFKLEAEYANGYDAKKKTIVCKDTVVDPAKDCKSASPGAPDKEEKLVARAGYSRFFFFGDSDSGLGISPLASYDTLSGDIGAELPIFLKVGKKSPILPGVTLGYAKDTSKASGEDEELTIKFFLKTSFSL